MSIAPGHIDGTFELAAPELAAIATAVQAAPGDASQLLDDARAELLRRLHARSDDFAATRALCALEAYAARLQPTRSGDAQLLVRAGSSCNARRWWRPFRDKSPGTVR